jgi:hypothetical protein
MFAGLVLFCVNSLIFKNIFSFFSLKKRRVGGREDTYNSGKSSTFLDHGGQRNIARLIQSDLVN